MAKIEREIQHSLGLDGAKTAANTLLEKLQSSYGSVLGDISWNDDKTAADIKGKGFTCKFCVTDTCLKINIELGLLASAFKGKIEQEIDAQAKNFK